MSTETTPDNVPALRQSQPSLAPQNFREAMEFSKLLAQSAFVPKDFRGKPAEILAAIQFGFELGVGPMQALQNIAVINGKPSVYGDLALALVQASGLMEYIKESDDGKVATCETKRRGYPAPCITTFSDDDAKAAGLLGKSGPWTQYRARMRMFRARGFNLRDNYADVLKGLITREEAEDYPTHRNEPYAPSAGTADAAIDTSAEQVDTATGEVLNVERPKPTDKASPEQRMKLTDMAHGAMGKEDGQKWIGARLEELGKRWGDVTVADIQNLTTQLLEAASANQNPPDDSGNIDFPEEKPAELSKDIEKAERIVGNGMDRVQSSVGNGNLISEAQGKRLYAIAKGNGETLRYVLSQHGYSHSREIPKARYDAIVAAVEKAVNV